MEDLAEFFKTDLMALSTAAWTPSIAVEEDTVV